MNILSMTKNVISGGFCQKLKTKNVPARNKKLLLFRETATRRTIRGSCFRLPADARQACARMSCRPSSVQNLVDNRAY